MLKTLGSFVIRILYLFQISTFEFRISTLHDNPLLLRTLSRRWSRVRLGPEVADFLQLFGQGIFAGLGPAGEVAQCAVERGLVADGNRADIQSLEIGGDAAGGDEQLVDPRDGILK